MDLKGLSVLYMFVQSTSYCTFLCQPIALTFVPYTELIQLLPTKTCTVATVGLWRHVVVDEVAVHARGLLLKVTHLSAMWQYILIKTSAI